MKKTPAEIEAMALVVIPVAMAILDHTEAYDLNKQDRIKWVDGYTSNTELEEFKKGLLAKVKGLYRGDDENPNSYINGMNYVLNAVLELIQKDDQLPVKKEEKIGPKMILCPQCNKLRDSENIKKYGMCFNCHY